MGNKGVCHLEGLGGTCGVRWASDLGLIIQRVTRMNSEPDSGQFRTEPMQHQNYKQKVLSI